MDVAGIVDCFGLRMKIQHLFSRKYSTETGFLLALPHNRLPRPQAEVENMEKWGDIFNNTVELWPRRVESVARWRVVSVACGPNCTAVLTDAGKLHICGSIP